MKKRCLPKYPDGGKKKNPQTSIRMNFKKMPSDNLGSYTAPHKYVAPEDRPIEPIQDIFYQTVADQYTGGKNFNLGVQLGDAIKKRNPLAAAQTGLEFLKLGLGPQGDLISNVAQTGLDFANDYYDLGLGKRIKYPDGGEVAGKTGMMKARMALEAEFGNPAAKRMISPNPLTYNFTGNEPDDFWRDKPQAGESGTHYISNGGKYAIPMLQEKQNKLQYIQNPSPNDREAMEFQSPEDAEYFAEHYKEIAPMMRNFKEYKYGGIHIKPENKGKFTATKKATGKSTEELTHSKNPVTRKRAIFAQNAAKWQHADGGVLNEYPNGGKISVSAGGEKHLIYKKESPTGNGKGIEGHIMVNHPTMDKGKWDTIDLTDIAGAKTITQGAAATKKWHKENPEYANGGMIKRADGSYSKRGLWDNIRANVGSGKAPTKEMLKQESKIKAEMAMGGYMYADGGKIPQNILESRLESHMSPEQTNEYLDQYGSGGYTVKRSSERKGKTHVVIGPDGTKKYFGDSHLGQHPNDPARKKAFYARHKHNLDGNPYFRAFARKTWAEGGILDEPSIAMPPRTLKKFTPGGTTLPEGNWAGVDPTTGKPTQTNFNNSTTGSNISTGASIAGAVVPMITSMIPDQTVRDSEGNSVGQKVGTGKAIASGAASGAAAGAMLGPWGALAGAGVGAIYGGISNSMANNKIDAEMKQANSRISNRKLDNRMTTNNNAFATQDYNNNDMVYAAGGMVVDQHMDDPNAELELNETFQEPSGQVGMVDGPSHDNGGVEVNLEEGTRIWSDRLKHNGKTFASLTKPIVNKIEKLEKASPTDYNSRFKQNSKMLLNKQLDHLFEVQETNKQQDEMKRSLKNNAVVNDRGNYHYAMGGMLPRYAEAGTVSDPSWFTDKQIMDNRYYGLASKGFNRPDMSNAYNKYNKYTLNADNNPTFNTNYTGQIDTPYKVDNENYGPIGPITEQQMLNQKEVGTAWLNNLGNRFEGDPLASTREWLNKKTVDFTAHPVQKTPEVVVPKRNWFKDNANTIGQLSTLGATLAAQNANVNKLPAPRNIGNVNFQNQIVNPKYMDLSAERAAINRVNMGAMDESQRQFGNSATAQAFKNKARLNQLEGLGKSYQTQENTNASIYNQFAGMQGEAGIKQAMANTDIDRQNAENWYGDKAMRLSNKNAAIATAGHGVGEIFGNNATYANELEKANILANQHEGTVLADMYKNNPRLFNDAYRAGHISPYDYNRITGQTPEIVPPTIPPTTTPPQIGPPKQAYGGIIKRRKLKR